MSDQYSKAVLTDDFAKAIDCFYRLWRGEFASEEAMEEEKELMNEIIQDYARTLSTKRILYELEDEEDCQHFDKVATLRLNRELPGNYYSTQKGRIGFYQMIGYLRRTSELLYDEVCDVLQLYNFSRDWINVFLKHFEIGSMQELRTKITDIVKAGPVNLGGGIYMNDMQVRNLNVVARSLVQDETSSEGMKSLMCSLQKMRTSQ